MTSLRKRRKHSKNTAILSSTKKAVKQTRKRVKKQLLSLMNKTKSSIRHMTTKVNTTVAKKIRSLTK
jgi:hypothetical protein|uniref:Uncharacterized protein n=1 Tax=viral metagenome TaxID=1070528 RepID=A0A6C0BFD2_9ZZZZ